MKARTMEEVMNRFFNLGKMFCQGNRKPRRIERREHKTSKSPEQSVEAVMEALKKIVLYGRTWKVSVLENEATVLATMNLSETFLEEATDERAAELLELTIEIEEKVLGGSEIRFRFDVLSNSKSSKIDEIITYSSRYVGMAVVEAEVEETLAAYPNGQTSKEVMIGFFGREYNEMFHGSLR